MAELFELNSNTSLLVMISFGMTLKANIGTYCDPNKRVMSPTVADTGSCSGGVS